MHVRCPNCHSSIELTEATSLAAIQCSACGSSFSLIGDETVSYHGSGVQTLGHFELIDRVGAGTFGTVWMARDTELDRTVAIKIPRKGQLSAEETEQFLREARAAAQLQHPNIVSVHEVGREGDTVYIVSDFVRGATLDSWLDDQRFTFREAAELCAKIAEALDHAHQAGVIHRDLKPGNIMIAYRSDRIVAPRGHAGEGKSPDESGHYKRSRDKSGQYERGPDESGDYKRSPDESGHYERSRDESEGYEPFIMDFGLAKREAGEVTMTVDGRVLGTPAYMSPEQARGEAHYADRRSDIYSLGVILFRLLTGELPFRGNRQMLILQIINEEPASPRRLDSRIPRDLETICLKCLQKNSDRRYQTSAELAAELRRWLRGEPIRARPAGSFERTAKWVRRRPTAAALLVVSSVAGLSLLVGSLYYNARLRAALQNAAQEQQRAEANFQKALAAVDRMLTEVGEKRLGQVPQMEEERQRLLEAALDFYRQFLQEDSSDAVVRRETASAYQRTARIYQTLGNFAAAEKSYQEALSIQASLVSEQPQQAEYRYDQATSYMGLGDLLGAGRAADAQAAYQQAITILDRLADEFPAVSQYAVARLTCYKHLGDLYRDTGQTASAEKSLQTALDIANSLATKHSNDAAYLDALAGVYDSFGRVYRDAGQIQQGTEAFRAAIRTRQQLLEHQPANPDYLDALAESLTSLSGLFRFIEPTQEAKNALERAVEIREQLAREYPRVLEYQNALSSLYQWLGWRFQMDSDHQLAAEAFTKSVSISETLARDYPNEIEFAVKLAMGCGFMANLLRDTGRHEESLPWYDRNFATFERVLQQEPRHLEARLYLTNTHANRAELMVRLSRRDEARHDWNEIIRITEGQDLIEMRDARARTWAHLGNHERAIHELKQMTQSEEETFYYNAACTYSVASSAVLKDDRISPQQRAELADEYAREALALLRKAAQEGYFKQSVNVEYFKVDRDFESMRSRPDFEEFSREVAREAAERGKQGR